MRSHFSAAERFARFATSGQYAATRISVRPAYEMLGLSLCSLLMRSFISFARSMLVPDAISLACPSVRRLETEPMSGQSRPAALPWFGAPPRVPLNRKINAICLHRRSESQTRNRVSDCHRGGNRFVQHCVPIFVRREENHLIGLEKAQGVRCLLLTHTSLRCFRYRRTSTKAEEMEKKEKLVDILQNSCFLH